MKTPTLTQNAQLPTSDQPGGSPMTGLKPLFAALLLAGAASPGLVQAACLVTDPPFLAEGPISAVSGLAGEVTLPDLTLLATEGSVTAMGVRIDLPEDGFAAPIDARVTTPTAILDMAGFAATTPFPGRTQDGFLGATVISEGCVKVDPVNLANNVYLADFVFSDVSENVLLGVVTANPGASGLVEVMGTPVSVLADPRMPGPKDAFGNPTWTRLGIPVVTASIPLFANAALEGYFSNDGSGVLHVWSVDVDAGTPVLPNDPQTGISEWRCGPVGEPGRLQVIGGSYTPAEIVDGIATCGQTLTVVNAQDTSIVYGTGTTTATIPPSDFCEYLVRFDVAACPAGVTVFNSNGSFATTLPDAAPNTPPTGLDDAYETTVDTPLSVVAPGVLANDTDPDVGARLTAVLVTDSANDGNVELQPDGSFLYTPPLGFVGTDSFTYQAVDNAGALSNVATVSITVARVAQNEPPVAVDDVATTAEDTAVTIAVLANDSDPNGDPLTVTAVTNGANGTVTTNGTTVTYTPALNFNGTDSFTYTVSDGVLSATASVTVTVTPVNDPPVAVNDAFTTDEDSALTITDADLLANDTDVEDGTPTGIAVITNATNGTVARDGTSITFTPALNFSGTASFQYRAQDSAGAQSNLATVTITVTPVNDAPVAVNDTATTTAGVPVTINVLANDTDVDDAQNTLVVANLGGLVGGTAVINANNTVTFTPAAGFTGAGGFTYQARDPAGALSNVATVSVTVNAAPPVVVDLDIQGFTATNQVRLTRGQTVALSLNVRNNSALAAAQAGRPATIRGVLNGVQVYSVTQTVTDAPGGGATANTFPSYTPGATGTITWTATIADDDPDLDQATAATNVRQ